MSNGTAIKRFTYDWLIRFAELHPFQPYDQKTSQNGPFNPLTSKYASISPMFANLMTRHMPYLFYGDQLCVRNRQIVKKFGVPPELQDFELPSPKKLSIYICGVCHITELTPDIFTWFKDNRITFYGEHLYMTNRGATVVNRLHPHPMSSLTLRDLQNFGTTGATTALAAPIPFSELCPFIAQYKDITFKIKVIYDTSFINIARKYRLFPDRFCAHAQDISDNVMLKMLDYFLSLPVRPSELQFTFKESKPIASSKTVIDKIVSTGIEKQHCQMPHAPFVIIRINILSETQKFDCAFLPATLKNLYFL